MQKSRQVQRKNTRKNNKQQRNKTSFRAFTPINTYKYFDAELVSQAVSTTTYGPETVLGQLLNDTTSVCALSPGIRTVSMVANDPVYNVRIRLLYAELRNRVVGAQSNSLLSGDLYNSVRFILYLSGFKYSDSPAATLTSVDAFPNLAYVSKVFYDKQYSLPSQAFDSANGYNVPQVISDLRHIPLNVDLDLYTENNSGTSGWDTRFGDLCFEVVSDSSATPHPNISSYFRIYYEIL